MKTVVAAALGECVHVAGVYNFLRLAEEAGWRTVFLGPAVSSQAVIAAARREQADLVAVSYRLTPETGARLFAEFATATGNLRTAGVRFIFGGTPPVAKCARKIGLFERVFDGNQPVEEILAYLRGETYLAAAGASYPQTLLERIRWKAPYPVLRHHFGLPTMEKTLAGITKIASSRLLDVISLGPDQEAQENFFHPERQNPRRTGAGGVPVRTPDDFQRLYRASRTGNFPLLRTYAGTDDFIRLAAVYRKTINNAWCAVPLFWFNQMDGRGPWDLEGSIREHQKLMQWHGERALPVEINEPHHWGMRDAPDVVFVVAAYLSAYSARAYGVRDYVAQLMFNSPPGLSATMDLAKMLAILEMIAPLAGENFRIWRQTRTGLLSYPLEVNAARAHLAASIYQQMFLNPHIVHIVGHTEAHHAATAADVLAACRMARQSIENARQGQPDLTTVPQIVRRKEELIRAAGVTLQAIRGLHQHRESESDPLLDPATLARAVKLGILDAPHLRNNPFAPGRIRTRIIQGACLAVDDTGKPLPERERLRQFLSPPTLTASGP